MTTIQHRPDVNPAGLGSGATDKAQSAQGQAASTQTQIQPATGTGAPPQEVQITPAAQLLVNVEQQLATVPEVDQGRVDAIRQALNNGTYQVDSGRVADGVLAAQIFDAQAAAGSGAEE